MESHTSGFLILLIASPVSDGRYEFQSAWTLCCAVGVIIIKYNYYLILTCCRFKGSLELCFYSYWSPHSKQLVTNSISCRFAVVPPRNTAVALNTTVGATVRIPSYDTGAPQTCESRNVVTVCIFFFLSMYVVNPCDDRKFYKRNIFAQWVLTGDVE